MSGDLRVLCVCTHNRTRSVMMQALLTARLDQCGVPAAVSSGGLIGGAEPPTDESVRRMRSRGYDVAAHRSRRVDDDLARESDLIVAAEHHHVVQLAGRSPEVFARTFTLPELVQRGETVGVRGGGELAEWLDEVNAGRPAAFDYLDARVDEIDDPTGRAGRDWDRAVAELDDLTFRLAKLLA